MSTTSLKGEQRRDLSCQYLQLPIERSAGPADLPADLLQYDVL